MNAKLKAALYVLCSILGGLALFGLIALIVITDWADWIFAGIFTLAIIYGSYKGFYTIFKD